MKQQVKKVLMFLPPMRRYLAEKYTLDSDWKESAAKCDRLSVEVQNQRGMIEAISAERDALAHTHSQLALETERQTRTNKAIVAERDTLARQRDELQSEVDKQRVDMQVLGAERDTLQAERERLLSIIGRHEITLENLAIERQRLFDERVKYYDSLLGKMTALKAEYGSLERNLTRLANVPKELVSEQSLRNSYLNLLEDALTGMILKDESLAPGQPEYDQDRRELGRDWPKFALTMIGKVRMRNIRDLAETVICEGIPGDFLEAGVWRGGACIYMRGILKAYGVEDRRLWVADSFAGLPPPNPELYPADAGDPHHTFAPLVVSLDEVRENFSDYGLLDDRVQFLKGWFKDTLPDAPIKRLALLRLDGDMYESTIQTLDALYWKLSPAGFVIIDDYILPGCRKAVDDFRKRHRIQSRIEEVDGAAVYWRKLDENQQIAAPGMTKLRGPAKRIAKIR